jgi:ABC-type multidrug transport system fused ATPase/permease subunit
MAKENKINPEELRYNYLGFDVAPGKIKEFWASEQEKKKYLEKIKERLEKKKAHSIERDFSMVNASLLNPADRIIISIASVLMIISLILPYYNFQAYGSRIIGSALGYLANIAYIGSFVAWGNPLMKLIFVFTLVMILFSPLVGILNLLALNSGRRKENYFRRLKSIAKLNILAILLYLVMFILIATGQTNPFGSLGIEALGENLSLLSLINMSSFSLWLNIGAHFLGMVPALEL